MGTNFAFPSALRVLEHVLRAKAVMEWFRVLGDGVRRSRKDRNRRQGYLNWLKRVYGCRARTGHGRVTVSRIRPGHRLGISLTLYSRNRSVKGALNKEQCL